MAGWLAAGWYFGRFVSEGHFGCKFILYKELDSNFAGIRCLARKLLNLMLYESDTDTIW